MKECVGWSAVCWAAALNQMEILRYLIYDCDFDIHFINHHPHKMYSLYRDAV